MSATGATAAVSPAASASTASRRCVVQVRLPAGEMAGWIGATLVALDAQPGLEVRIAPSPAPGEATASLRWWQGRWLRPLPWHPTAEQRQRLSAWESGQAVGASQAAPATGVDIDLDLCAAALPMSNSMSNASTPTETLAASPTTSSAQGPSEGVSSSPAAAEARGAGPVRSDPAPLRWCVTDLAGRPLCRMFPLLEPVTGGEGLGLQLVQHDPTRGVWQSRRRLHRGIGSRYARALGQLPDALSRLVGQAVLDWRLGNEADREPAPVLPPCAPPGPSALGRRLAAGVWRAWLARHRRWWSSEYWRIGVVDRPLAELLDGRPWPPVRWLTQANEAGYWADPFAVPGSADSLCCERFDERSGIGRLERLRLAADGTLADRQPLEVGRGGSHASFPLMFMKDGRRLGLAETVASGECRLHEVSADGQWRPLFALLSGVAAADPALFEWEGRCWLAYTDVGLGASDNLCLYHAERLEGPWQAHANNPVKVDIRGARMAGGLFRDRGQLYRPAQDCLASYGAAVVVHRIVRCTPTEFVEEFVGRWSPDPAGACPDGLHTVSAWGERTLVDGKRHAFNGVALRRKLVRRLSRAAA